MNVRHVILDRDGVLNRELPGLQLVRTPAEMHWLPGALEGLALLRRANQRVSIVTNQSGVGRGLMSGDALGAIHQRMRDEAEAAGGLIHEILYCTHTPEDACECRKPAPALLRAAIARSGINAAETVALGDAERDLVAGWVAGVQTALVRTGKGKATEARLRGLGVGVYDDLLSFAHAIAANSREITAPALTDPRRVFEEHASVVGASADRLSPIVQRVVAVTFCALRNGHKVMACGNGGSAADAQHLVAELVGRFRDTRKPLPAYLLSGDPATMTAVANDFGYDQVFARPIEALAARGDVLFAFSTSGASANIIRAASTGRQSGCTVIALTGGDGGELARISDLVLCVPSTVVARIQEVHGVLNHMMCEALDALLRDSNARGISP